VTEITNRYFVMFEDKNLSEEDRKQIVEEIKWRKWVDNTFVHTLR